MTVNFVRGDVGTIEKAGANGCITRWGFRGNSNRVDVIDLVEIKGGKAAEQHAADAVFASSRKPGSERLCVVSPFHIRIGKVPPVRVGKGELVHVGDVVWISSCRLESHPRHRSDSNIARDPGTVAEKQVEQSS